MFRNIFLKNVIFTIISFIPAIYLLVVWSNIPQTVPTHFGINGPDHFQPKESLRTMVFIMSAVTAGCYFLIQYIYKLDPKRVNRPQASVFNKIATGITLFLVAINIVLIYTGMHEEAGTDRIAMVLTGLFFAFMGNIMYSIKPNYFAGIRTPWALNNDTNWRKTHQLGGILWFSGGILLTISSLIFDYEVVSRFMVGVVITFVLIPYGYSYFLFRRQQANGNTDHDVIEQ